MIDPKDIIVPLHLKTYRYDDFMLTPHHRASFDRDMFGALCGVTITLSGGDCIRVEKWHCPSPKYWKWIWNPLPTSEQLLELMLVMP